MKLLEIQETLYKTIEKICEKINENTDFLYIVEGVITEIDALGNYYTFTYQGEEYIGSSITGMPYKKGDLVYILFSNKKNIKKMILSKVNYYSTDIHLEDVEKNKKAILKLEEEIKKLQKEITILKEQK